jgi:hypothetical protein
VRALAAPLRMRRQNLNLNFAGLFLGKIGDQAKKRVGIKKGRQQENQKQRRQIAQAIYQTASRLVRMRRGHLLPIETQ